MSGRPTGSGATASGWFAFAGAAVLGTVGLFAQRHNESMAGYRSLTQDSVSVTGGGLDYSSLMSAQQAAEQAATSFYLILGAGGLLSLAVMLWCVGYIVKAISFLPGREDEA